MITDPDPGAKPLRADAERNRRRILDAARDLFAQRGLGVTLNDIAHHAGVGVGTVYRRFPDKADLIDSMFEERLAEMEDLLRASADDPDPWHGITTFLEQALLLQASDQGLRELVTAMPDGLQRVGRVRARLQPLAIRLVRRAQQAGQLREDIVATDLPLIQVMLRSLMDTARDVAPELWRRYLEIALRGMSADPAAISVTTPPLAPKHIERVMSASKRPTGPSR